MSNQPNGRRDLQRLFQPSLSKENQHSQGDEGSERDRRKKVPFIYPQDSKVLGHLKEKQMETLVASTPRLLSNVKSVPILSTIPEELDLQAIQQSQNNKDSDFKQAMYYIPEDNIHSISSSSSGCQPSKLSDFLAGFRNHPPWISCGFSPQFIEICLSQQAILNQMSFSCQHASSLLIIFSRDFSNISASMALYDQYYGHGKDEEDRPNQVFTNQHNMEVRFQQKEHFSLAHCSLFPRFELSCLYSLQKPLFSFLFLFPRLVSVIVSL